ncbi:MFS transporter [Rubellicoccus peritrichatus]|uniref:MFS transporter n=1 Tax=Rubellicoccus peritrichatus TaxID=3080537 RepID=A0AAQ3LA99_9BACT|nr:MFS transporter [Puniceicoccus sp. CR14]WOO42524.1 MFS transporter [Puniceicoccus sp. CR14]
MTNMDDAGHKYRWFLWILTTAMLAFVNLEYFTAGAVASSVQKSLKIDTSDIGTLFGTYTLCYAVMQLPVGLAYARFNPFRLLIFACTTFALGNITFAWAPSFGVAAGGLFIAGIGGAFFFLGYFYISAKHFEPVQFARLMGYNQTAKYALMLVALVAIPAILSIFNWRIYFTAVGCVFLLFTIPLCVFNRIVVVDRSEQRKTSIWKDLRILFSSRQVLYILFVGFLGVGFIIAFSGLWYVPFAEKLGYSSNKADWMTASMMFSFAVGVAATGWLSDYLKKRKAVMIWGFIGTLLPLCVVLIWRSSPLWLEIVFLMLVTTASTAFYPVIYSLAKESVSAGLATTVGGVLNTAIFLGVAFMQFMPGLDLHLLEERAAASHTGSVTEYQWALVVYPIALIVCFIASFRLKETGGVQPE